MYANKKEFDALHDAIDFVSTNIDGAEDQEYYQGIVNELTNLFEKIKKDRYNKYFKYYLKKNRNVLNNKEKQAQ